MINLISVMNTFQWVCLALLCIILAVVIAVIAYCLYRTVKCKKPILDVVTAKDKDFTPTAELYAANLSAMLKLKTISSKDDANLAEMYEFHTLVKTLYPRLAKDCEFKDFNGGLLIKWAGKNTDTPLVLMSHLDVVPARGKWDFDAFSGEIKEGIVHGRGAVDTKGNLCAILEACEGLIAENYMPDNDIYVFASSREEIGGEDAPSVCRYLKDNNIRPRLVVDEGGAIMDTPLVGVNGRFAMVAMSERASARIILSAKATGGASGMERLSKFILKARREKLSKLGFTPEVKAMFGTLTPHMVTPMKFIFANTWLFGDLLLGLLPKVSKEAQAMLGATLSFGACTDEENFTFPLGVATTSATIACTYYTDIDACIAKFNTLCEKFGITATVAHIRRTVRPEPLNSTGYTTVANTVRAVFDNVAVSPFIIFGGTDSRHFVSIADSVIRFAPLHLTGSEFRSFHNVNEQLHVDSLVGAVRFFRELVKQF